MPFTAGNDNETAVHRRIKRLSLSFSLYLFRSIARPCRAPAAGIFRETRPRAASSFGCLFPPLSHGSSSTSFRAVVSEDKGILFLRLLLLVHGPVPLSRRQVLRTADDEQFTSIADADSKNFLFSPQLLPPMLSLLLLDRWNDYLNVSYLPCQ